MDPTEIKADVHTLCHWYEEAPNVTSASRLVAGVAVGAMLVLLGLAVAYVVVSLERKGTLDAQVLHELGFIMLGLAGTASTATATRNLGARD